MLLKFSVLISVYNREKPRFLENALRSIVDQTLLPNEIVLVKDGPLSIELNRAIGDFESRYGDILNIIELKRNMGLGNALKIGLLNCSYDFIARMDSDDICLPDRFEKQITYLKKNPQIDLVGSWISEFNTDPRETISIRKVPTNYDAIYRFSKFRNPVNHMAVIFKKSSVLRAGNYYEFSPVEDYYLWFKMLNQGAKFANIPECLVQARIGNGRYKRRRGIEYLQKEIELFKIMRKEKYISEFEYLRNILSRVSTRLLPPKALRLVYEKLAR